MAFSVAVLLCGSGAALFSASGPASAPPRPPSLPRVVMLPVDGPAVNPWHGQLLAWLDLRDPTVLSLPNSRYGFSKVLEGESARPLEERRVTGTLAEPAAAFQAAVPRIGPEPPEDVMGAVVTARLSRPRLQLPRFAGVPARHRQEPAWIDGRGLVLAWMPVPDLPEGAAASPPPEAVTELLFERLPAAGDRQLPPVLRVRVVRSCGDARRDVAAAVTGRQVFQRRSLAEQAAVWLDGRERWRMGMWWGRAVTAVGAGSMTEDVWGKDPWYDLH